MRDNIRHQGIFRYLTKLVNAIDSRFVGLLHWGVEKIFQIFTVMLYQAGGFYLVLGKDTTCCQFSLLLCALPLWLFLDVWRRYALTSIHEIISQIFALTRLTIWTNSPIHGVSPVTFTCKKRLARSKMIHKIEYLESMVIFIPAFRTGSSPRRPLFLHAVSFEWNTKLEVNYFNQFSFHLFK